MIEYSTFLETKTLAHRSCGVIPERPLNPNLFDFQQAIVRWALAKGRAAVFADCGLGKTLIQLEWANHIPGKVLIAAPLAVAEQTVREGERFGIDIQYSRTGEIDSKITITNYEMLQHFDASRYTGLVIDESSILKSFDGSTRNQIINAFVQTPYKLACTATPAPNDYMELGNHSEFLGVMSTTEMLATFFVHDGGDTSQWRLKRHAQDPFWRWIASWAVLLKKPSDIGFDDRQFILPPLTVKDTIISTDIFEAPPEGMLFRLPAQTLTERRQARKDSLEDRCKVIADAVNAAAEPCLIWCNFNAEGDLLEKLIPGAVQVAGSDNPKDKVERMLGFASGKYRVLISKPSICGFGMNWQHCSRVFFVGISDSWEEYYQAVRRCWRFGQKNEVIVVRVVGELEINVLKNVQRKETDAERMGAELILHMKEFVTQELFETKRETIKYGSLTVDNQNWKMHLGDCVETIKTIESDSIHYTIFSPPFASLYTYSNSDRDMGNSADHDTFYQHFSYLVPELLRVTMPGRALSFHCMNLPTSKSRDGQIGLTDFRGNLIRMFTDAGWIYHSEVVIWKDPVTAMQRTKALGLLHKQLKKDSCMSRQGIPDYLITMRKPGDNAERVTHTNESFPVSEWQQYASPVWMDINPSDTLQFREAREHQDERHICPLQLQVIERALRLWSNAGDLVLSPFAGIGSEGYVALKNNRRFVGIELKETYWKLAQKYLEAAEIEMCAKLPLFAEALNETPF